MDVEDNAFLVLKAKKSISWLHASWTEWKTYFRLRYIIKGKIYG